MDKDMKQSSKHPPVAMVMLFFSTVAGFIFILYTQGYFDETRRLAQSASKDPLLQTQNIYLIVLSAIMVFLFSFAAYFLYMFIRISRFRQFPPPGAKILKNARTVKGDEARRIGLVFLILACVFAMAGFAAPMIGSMILRVLQ